VSGFDVTVGELAGGAAVVEESSEDLAAELTRLAALVEDTLTSSWRGDAATSFGRAWAEWAAGAREVIAALAAMSAALRSTGATYAAAEQASVTGL
jgi:WXG100 family type VII secretion target